MLLLLFCNKIFTFFVEKVLSIHLGGCYNEKSRPTGRSAFL